MNYSNWDIPEIILCLFFTTPGFSVGTILSVRAKFKKARRHPVGNCELI